MVNVNIDRLTELKKAVDSGARSQNVDVQNTQSYVDDGYYERSKKFIEIKNYIESRVAGITVSVSGGRKLKDRDEFSDFSYEPIVITTFRNNDRASYNVVKVDGFFIDEGNAASMIYADYLGFFIEGSKYIESHTVSFWENVLKDALDETCLSECGFYADGNFLIQLKDNKSYTIINDIATDVQGIIKLNLPDNEDESIIVMCCDRNILISDDNFYIDAA